MNELVTPKRTPVFGDRFCYPKRAAHEQWENTGDRSASEAFIQKTQVVKFGRPAALNIVKNSAYSMQAVLSPYAHRPYKDLTGSEKMRYALRTKLTATVIAGLTLVAAANEADAGVPAKAIRDLKNLATKPGNADLSKKIDWSRFRHLAVDAGVGTSGPLTKGSTAVRIAEKARPHHAGQQEAEPAVAAEQQKVTGDESSLLFSEYVRVAYLAVCSVIGLASAILCWKLDDDGQSGGRKALG